MKACLYLSNDKFVEIDNLEKVIKSGHRGTVEISKEKLKVPCSLMAHILLLEQNSSYRFS